MRAQAFRHAALPDIQQRDAVRNPVVAHLRSDVFIERFDDARLTVPGIIRLQEARTFASQQFVNSLSVKLPRTAFDPMACSRHRCTSSAGRPANDLNRLKVQTQAGQRPDDQLPTCKLNSQRRMRGYAPALAEDFTILVDLGTQAFDAVQRGAGLRQHLAAGSVAYVVFGLDLLPKGEAELAECSWRVRAGEAGIHESQIWRFFYDVFSPSPFLLSFKMLAAEPDFGGPQNHIARPRRVGDGL
jgi:hypothetical protein